MSRPRPNGAYKLFVMLQDMPPPLVQVQLEPACLYLPSLRRLSRVLGTDSKTVRRWLDWLYTMGYLPGLQYDSARRAATLTLRSLRNATHG